MADPDDKEGSTPELRDVVRHRENVLQSFPQFYAFITRREGPPSGPWHVIGECLPQRWMDRVWGEMSLAGDLRRTLGTAPFEETYPGIDGAARQVCYDAWQWFVDRATSSADPMEASGVEILITPENANVILSDWYLIRLSHEIGDESVPDLPYAEAPRCFHTVFQPGHPDAEKTVLRQVLNYERVADSRGQLVNQGALKALHFPHCNPSDLPPTAEPSPPGSSGGPLIETEDKAGSRRPLADSEPTRPDQNPPPPLITVSRQRLGRLLAGLSEGVRTQWRELGDRLNDCAEVLFAPALQPAYAGGAGFLGRAEPMYYLGSPAPNEGDPQPENPLTLPGPQHSFVGVLDVGQGNCQAIYDANHRILAYFDIGHPWGHMASSRPGLRPPLLFYTLLTPCVCDRPLMILSHWDLDHFKLGLDTEATQGMAWLAPEQNYGPPGTQLVGKIQRQGGVLQIWHGPGHMTFPWGFLERCSAGMANFNSSGLAAFVCVRDDPNIERMRQAVNAVAGLIGGPLLHGAPPDIGNVARPVAAALATYSGAIAPADAARAAVRAAIAARLGGLVAATAAFIGQTDGAAAPLTALLNPDQLASLPAAVALSLLQTQLTAQSAMGVAGANPLVPGGNLARATAAAAPFAVIADKVLAVCHAVPATAPNPTVTITQGAGPRAVGAIDGLVGPLAGPPPHTAEFAKTLAAAMGTTDVGANLPAGDVENFAVRMVVALSGAGAQPDGEIAAFVHNANAPNALNVRNLLAGALVASLPPPPAGIYSFTTLLWIPAARGIILAGPGNLAAQANAAQNTPIILASAQRATNALTNAGQARLSASPGLAHYSSRERFVLLNADANFDFVPSLQGLEPPVVVAMTAMHHGSLLEDDIFLDDEHIPWAPGTAAAGSAAVAVAADNNHWSACHCIAETASQLMLQGAAGAGLRDRIAHAGAAAAAAVLVTRAGLRAHLVPLLTGAFQRNLSQAAACAVMSRLLAATEPEEVAIAALIGGNARDRLLPAHEFAAAAQCARMEARGPNLQVQIELVVATQFPFVEKVPIARMAMLLRPRPVRVLDYDQIRSVMPAMAEIIHPGPGYTELLAPLAACAWEAANAPQNHETSAAWAQFSTQNPAAVEAAVHAVMAIEITALHNHPVDAREVARNAAELAMIAEAIRATGVNRFELTSALRSLTSGSHQAAATAALVSAGHGPGPIAYSYGVYANNAHCYPALTVGGFGHPHPMAIAEYQARGWTVRRNAAANAGHAAPQGDLSPRGHVALAWDYVTDRNLVFANAIGNRAAAYLGNPNGILDLPACATCNQRIWLNL